MEQKNLKTLILILLISVCLLYVNRQKVFGIKRTSKFETFLTGGNQKYWTLLSGGFVHRTSGHLYMSSGVLIQHHGLKNKGSISRFPTRFSSILSWEIKGHDSLSFDGEIIYKIEYINNDILVLKSFRDSSIATYIKSIDQITPIMEDTTKSDGSLYL